MTVYMARGFIPYSIEVGQDYPGFAIEMSTLLSPGYDELLVDKFTRGSGHRRAERHPDRAVGEHERPGRARPPAAIIGAPDPYKVWQALPQRFRRNASWLMIVATNNAIRQLGTANVYHAYTVNLPRGVGGHPVPQGGLRVAVHAGHHHDHHGDRGLAIVGDFRNYVIARRGGMSVELIPQLFQQVDCRYRLRRPDRPARLVRVQPYRWVVGERPRLPAPASDT